MKIKFQVIIILLGIMILFAAKSHAFSVQEGKIYRGCDSDSPNWLMHDWSLHKDSCLVSPNGLYMAIFQGNGHFATFRFHGVKVTDNNKVTFNMNGYYGKDSKLIWTSSSEKNKKGLKGQRLILQNDGNLVIYDSYTNKKAVWSSGTQHSGAKLLTLNDEGELVLSHGKGSETEYGPEIIGWKGHRKYRHRGNYVAKAKGKKANHTPSGVFITDVSLDDQMKTQTEFTPHAASARAQFTNCSTGIDATDSTGHLALIATVESSESWGRSSTKGYSSTIGIEIGNDAIGKLKKDFTVNKSFTVDHNMTNTETNTFDLTAEFDVKPGNKQRVKMLVYKAISKIPYTGYQYLKVEGISYLSRNKIHDEMVLENTYEANVVFEQAKPCSE